MINGYYREHYLNGRHGTVDLLIKAACFVKKKQIMFAISKAAYLNKLVQGDKLNRAFPFGKGSLATNLWCQTCRLVAVS